MGTAVACCGCALLECCHSELGLPVGRGPHMDASSGGTVTGRLELLTEDIMHADAADIIRLLPGAGAGNNGI